MYCDKVFSALEIVLWQLRYPVVLDSTTMSIQLYSHLRLLLVSDSYISINDPFIGDILRVVRVSITDICILTVNQIDNLILPRKYTCNCWWIGSRVLRNFCGICLITPALSILKCSVKAKRDLWHQISYVMHVLHKRF